MSTVTIRGAWQASDHHRCIDVSGVAFADKAAREG